MKVEGVVGGVGIKNDVAEDGELHNVSVGDVDVRDVLGNGLAEVPVDDVVASGHHEGLAVDVEGLPNLGNGEIEALVNTAALGERGFHEGNESNSLVDVYLRSDTKGGPVPWATWFWQDGRRSSFVVQHGNAEVVLEEGYAKYIGKGHLDEVVADALVGGEDKRVSLTNVRAQAIS